MRFRRLIAVLICFGFLPVVGFSQQSGPDRRPVQPRPSGIRVQPSTTVSRPATRNRPAPSVSAGTVSVPSSRNSMPGSSSPTVPVQTYTPQGRITYNNWYRTAMYIDRLMHRFWYLPGDSYLWRYAQGDSPLTQRSVELALRESRQAADLLSMLGIELQELITEYEAGRLAQAEFEVLVKAKVKEIRSAAKVIRKDDFLEFIDQRKDDKVPSYQKADSLVEMKALAQLLQDRITAVNQGLTSFYNQDMSRVVGVKELQNPSFDSLTKGIDRLAKTISNSAKRL